MEAYQGVPLSSENNRLENNRIETRHAKHNRICGDALHNRCPHVWKHTPVQDAVRLSISIDGFRVRVNCTLRYNNEHFIETFVP